MTSCFFLFFKPLLVSVQFGMWVNKRVQLEAQVTISCVLKSTTTLLIENEHLPPAVGTHIYIHISSRRVSNGPIVKARGHLAELRTGTKVGEERKKQQQQQHNRSAAHCCISLFHSSARRPAGISVKRQRREKKPECRSKWKLFRCKLRIILCTWSLANFAASAVLWIH